MKPVDVWTQIGSVLLGIVVMACASGFKTYIEAIAARSRDKSQIAAGGNDLQQKNQTVSNQ